MMERIGDHLSYLSKYATASQSSEEVQKVGEAYAIPLYFTINKLMMTLFHRRWLRHTVTSWIFMSKYENSLPIKREGHPVSGQS